MRLVCLFAYKHIFSWQSITIFFQVRFFPPTLKFRRRISAPFSFLALQELSAGGGPCPPPPPPLPARHCSCMAEVKKA
jgi:hypothetical protein